MPTENSANIYDVIVVGAGPAGATTAYFLAKGMGEHDGKRVALLDKASFPRDKYCGDAWCAPALDILEEMGVLQQLEADGLVQDCTSGGFVSPSGESYISTGEGPPLDSTRCYAIKRMICDERIARKAEEAGADLIEHANFAEAVLEQDGLWTITCKDGRHFRAKMLIAADGATSQVARSLGIVNTAPEGVASRQYVKGGTHNFKSGGVLFYPSYVLPGYVALFRHYNDDIDVGVYIIPGGTANPQDIISICENDVANDPFMQRILGPNAEYLEKPRVASLRTGGIEKSTAQQFMAVGDAAGQTDPLTGEGIHTGMIGGKLAAQRIHEMAAAKDFSAKACQVYHQRWMDDFGKDFPASATGAKMTHRFPLLLDAANVVAQRKGDSFMADFGATMTGVKPKSTFLRPGIALPLGLEVARQVFKQKFQKVYPSEPAAYQARAIEKHTRPTAFANACLLDSNIQVQESAAESNSNKAFEEMFQHAGCDPQAKRIIILYGTEYGFSKEMAELLCQGLAESSTEEGAIALSPRLVDMEYHPLIDWQETDTCLLLCATAGDGEVPQKAKAFFDLLENQQTDLSKVRTAILAFGDSAYPQFCAAGLALEKLIKQCGGQSFHAITKVDNEDMAVVNEWIDDMIDLLCEEAHWQTENTQTSEDKFAERAKEFFTLLGDQALLASSTRPHSAYVIENRPLANTQEGGIETVHLRLALSDNTDSELEALSWEAGDALGVLPVNDPTDVDRVIELLNCTPSELIELPKEKGTLSLHQALSNHCDIKNLPNNFLNYLSEQASDESEKSRLKALSLKANEYLAPRELQDLLQEFPETALSLDTQILTEKLHTLAPRYYSIASSQSIDNKIVDLTVAAVRYELLGRPRSGVTSTYLADRANEKTAIKVFVHKNHDFRLPQKDSKRACVMIGAGTGVAPYRAFLQELEQRAAESTQKNSAQNDEHPHLLFFGCRHEKGDFLYADEWKHYEAEKSLQLHTAFSRDQKNKIYVQDRIHENKTLLWERMQRGDHFYICGDASHMAVDVETALLELIQSQGNRSSDEAKEYLREMSKNQRYQKDVWAS